MSQIYYISEKDIDNKEILFNFIYPNTDITYYISDDFSPMFYIKLARAGFISVSDYLNDDQQYLFPEMQKEYALLDFENLHISKKVKKLLNSPDKFNFSINKDFEGILEHIDHFHNDNWMNGKYIDMLKKVKEYSSLCDFELISVELKESKSKKIVAGEIGYKIGRTYTSLSGFSNREYNNYGKLQMTLLAKHLENKGFAFWNMGHPYMDYKTDLGAKILSRKEFLNRWLTEVGLIF